MKKLFLLLLTVFAVSLCASAQMRTVTGTVLDAANGDPLPGASVTPGAGQNGVVTDINGDFSIRVPESVKKLVVSYVGFTTQTVNIGSGKITVHLESESELLDPVMVVAYGKQKKSSFTGSAAVINAADIEEAQVSNALNALTGKVAGVQLTNASGQPGATTPTIRIRGISSINAGNAPLVIVDGAPYSGDMNNINTADIESMTVLKDAASNALYGARGANGVILITTKKGGSEGDAIVSVDAKWGVNTRATQDYKTITNPAQYYETYYQALYNQGTLEKGLDAAAAHKFANANLIDGGSGLAYNIYNVPDGQYMIGTNGKLNPRATLGNVVTYRGQQFLLTPDNWLDEAYKSSLRQEYNVSVANGSEKGNFYASVGYLKNEGITKNSDYSRFTARLSADTQAKSWLRVGANLSYTHYDMHSMAEDGSSNSSGNIFAAATQVAPIYPLYIRNANGEILKDANGIMRFDYGDGANAGLVRPVYTESNALSSAWLDTNKSEGNAFSAAGFFEVRFLKDFTFTSNNTVNVDETRYTEVTNPYYGSYAESNGIVYKSHSRALNYTFQQLLNWDHKFGKHSLSALLGHENYWARSYSLSASRSNMFDPSNDELAGAVVNGNSSSSVGKYNNEGWLFRAQWDYDSKYFGSFSFRRDGSSRFHPDHRWGSFWSLGGAWIISREEWFPKSFVNFLKIKASYGEQGNDNIPNYLYTNTYDIVNSNGNPAVVPGTMGNPDITWEKNGNFNAGVEFGMWNDRLKGSVDFFYRRTSDMLSWVPLPPSYGWTGYYDNIGNMENIGVEVDLTGSIIRTKNFKWDVNLNLTYYKNKIVTLDENHKGLTVDGHPGYQTGLSFRGEGLPLYTYYIPTYAGPDENTGEATYWTTVTKPVLDENGVQLVDPVTNLGVTEKVREKTTDYALADYELHGTALPKVYGGFGTSLSYRDFDLSVDFAYQIGGQVYDSDYANYMTAPTTLSHGSNFHADILNAWTPDNKNTNIPRLCFDDQYTASTSDRFLVSASYLSLQNINFGYSLPKSIVRKLQLTKLRVYLSCDNVWLWSKRRGLDPRQSISGSASNTFYAPIRVISGGINITF